MNDLDQTGWAEGLAGHAALCQSQGQISTTLMKPELAVKGAISEPGGCTAHRVLLIHSVTHLLLYSSACSLVIQTSATLHRSRPTVAANEPSQHTSEDAVRHHTWLAGTRDLSGASCVLN